MGGPAFFFVLSLCVLCISPTPSRLRRTLCVHLHAIGAWLLSVCLVGPLPRRRSSILAARTRVRDQGTPAPYKWALIAVHVVAKPSFSTTKVETKPPLLPMTPVPRSRLTTRPPTRATLCRFKTTLTSRFAKTRSLCRVSLRHRRDVRTLENAPELAPG